MPSPSRWDLISEMQRCGECPEDRLIAAALLELRDEVARLNEELARTQRHVELPSAADREPTPAEASR